MLKMTSYVAICLYYYATKAFRPVLYSFGILWLAFVIHKLVSWALWVMSL